jgi:hypothetical protein
MAIQIAKKPKGPDFPSDCPPFQLFDEKAKIWRNKSIKEMTMTETDIILDRIRAQFIVLHDLPVIGSGKDKVRPDEYMHETFWGLRKICQQLGDRRIQLCVEERKRERQASKK